MVYSGWRKACERKAFWLVSLPTRNHEHQEDLCAAWQSHTIALVHSSNTHRCLLQASSSILHPPTLPTFLLVSKENNLKFPYAFLSALLLCLLLLRMNRLCSQEVLAHPLVQQVASLTPTQEQSFLRQFSPLFESAARMILLCQIRSNSSIFSHPIQNKSTRKKCTSLIQIIRPLITSLTTYIPLASSP